MHLVRYVCGLVLPQSCEPVCINVMQRRRHYAFEQEVDVVNDTTVDWKSQSVETPDAKLL